MVSPIDGTTRVGWVGEASRDIADAALEAAQRGFASWSRTPAEHLRKRDLISYANKCPN